MENATAINSTPNMLYHYTSFETLALILENRTICFNSLQYVDDMEEAETVDMANFGKYVYVSCWTDDTKELISLWNLYTPNMHGVRIGLPCYPFKKYHFMAGQYFLTADAVTYINIGKLFDEDIATISIDQPKLTKVHYTDDICNIYPQVKSCTPPNAVELFLNARSIKEAVGIKIKYSFDNLGKYKRKDWEFQHEWRYIITMTPMGLQESNPPSFEKQKESIRRVNDSKTSPPYEKFFLELDENAIRKMDIVLGPKMSDAEKIYVKALLNDHGLENNWRDSSLKIR